MTARDELRGSITALSDWMLNSASRHKFCDVSLTVRINNGAVSIIERTVTERVKPAEIIGGERGNSHR